VFDPGLGQVRAGFFFSRYGFNFRAIGQKPLDEPRKNKQREKDPAPGAGLIAAGSPESRQTGPKTGQIGGFWAQNGE
jgi:hypothetical protein